MVDPDEKGPNGQQLPSRALHIVGPNKMVSFALLYFHLVAFYICYKRMKHGLIINF